MTDIFLSRPNWVPPEYESGLDHFLEIIDKDLKLKPHTIGSTEYPIESPLDEVIEVMEKTSGVLVLGYPQIFIDGGKVKNKPIQKPTHLATEWNHIEASLAYARKLPLLIIHDIHVIRGIFDRGAINKFIYQKDLKEKSWASSNDISGALKNWKEKINSYSNREEYYKFNPLKVQSTIKIDKNDLTENAFHLLKEATKDRFGQIVFSDGVSEVRISTNNESLKFRKTENPREIALWKGVLEELENYGFIRSNIGGDGFEVTDRGYKIVEENSQS